MGDVGLDAVHGHGQFAGDLAVGAAFEEKVEDGGATRGGGCVELAVAGALALGFVPGGFFDFVAEEQAAGEMGDEEVPAAVVGAGEGGDVVAEFAGEGGGRRREVRYQAGLGTSWPKSRPRVRWETISFQPFLLVRAK